MAPTRRLFTIAGSILVIGLIAYMVSFAYVLRAGADDQRQATDAIVVLGAAQYDGRPSPVLEARLDHALVLYQQGTAPIIVLTGGVGTGDTTSEALVGKRYLEGHNIPPAALIVRPEGRSTVSSMEAIDRWLEREGLETVTLVSDPFHMARLRLEAERLDIIAYTSPTRTSPISGSMRGELTYYAAEAFKVPVAWIRSRR
jgi:uncharacterized SAM-binding protein YcdF (DUF218 family)